MLIDNSKSKSMRKILLQLLIMMLFKSGNAQYYPLPMTNAQWIYYGGINLLSCPSCIFVNYMYYTAGDTLINSISYVKISKMENPNLNNVAQYPTFTGAIRQDTTNRKIYIVLADSSYEDLLYDFSLQVGDTIKSVLHKLAQNCFGFNVETVLSIDSVSVNGNFHRRFNVSGSCGSPSYIEGIGSSYGLIFPNRMDNLESHLSCTKVNGQTYFPSTSSNCNLINNLDDKYSEHKIICSPNPFSNFLNIKSAYTTQLPFVISIYDIFGNQILSQVSETENVLIDLNKYSTGTYILKINYENISLYKKLVKM